jgi:hypothetical protein
MMRDAKLEFKTREPDKVEVAMGTPHNRQRMAEDGHHATFRFLSL